MGVEVIGQLANRARAVTLPSGVACFLREFAVLSDPALGYSCSDILRANGLPRLGDPYMDASSNILNKDAVARIIQPAQSAESPALWIIRVWYSISPLCVDRDLVEPARFDTPKLIKNG